jgi:hypothetical protein
MTDKDAERLADLLKRRADVYSPERAKPSYYGDGDIDLLRSIIDRLTQERDEAQAEVARLRSLALDELAAESQRLGLYEAPAATGEPAPDETRVRYKEVALCTGPNGAAACPHWAALVDEIHRLTSKEMRPQPAPDDVERAVKKFAGEHWGGFSGPIDCYQKIRNLADAVYVAARREERELHALDEALIGNKEP